jgi:HTH-type transcriptional regulator, sugar sensing transcriptional regulator
MELIKDLLNLGLTEYEAKVYSILLTQNIVNATDLCKMAGVPRGRIYDVINLLINKGFCITIPGTVKKFKAINPQTAINNMIERQKKKELEMKETAAKLQSVYEKQEENLIPINDIQVYTTKASMIKKALNMAENCQSTFRVLNKPPYVNKRSDYIVKRKSIFKSIYEVEYDDLENFLTWVEAYEQKGEEVRLIEYLPLKLIISDEKKLMFTIKNHTDLEHPVTSIVLTHSDIINGLIEYFEIYWQRAITIEEFRNNQKKSK